MPCTKEGVCFIKKHYGDETPFALSASDWVLEPRGSICSFSLRLHKENEPKEMRFAAARFFPKIGRFLLKRENLQHCIPFRVASNSSRFFTLESAQFLNGKNRKAACDFELVPYFWKY